MTCDFCFIATIYLDFGPDKLVKISWACGRPFLRVVGLIRTWLVWHPWSVSLVGLNILCNQESVGLYSSSVTTYQWLSASYFRLHPQICWSSQILLNCFSSDLGFSSVLGTESDKLLWSRLCLWDINFSFHHYWFMETSNTCFGVCCYSVFEIDSFVVEWNNIG